jgi:hypothetical protein
MFPPRIDPIRIHPQEIVMRIVILVLLALTFGFAAEAEAALHHVA